MQKRSSIKFITAAKGDIIKLHSEKRTAERYDHEAPIIYAYHNSDEFYHAKMCNFCKGGMCFEADAAIKPGSDIYVMMDEFAPDTIGAEIYEGYLAEVRWCQELADLDPILYRIGVKYYKTLIDEQLGPKD
jgi:hypothetical protein